MKTIVVALACSLLFNASFIGSINNQNQNKHSDVIDKLECLMDEHELLSRQTSTLSLSNSMKNFENQLNDAEIIELALAEINQSVSVENFYSFRDAYDVSDFSSNQYLLVVFAPYGSMVISRYNYVTVEVNHLDDCDYTVLNDYDVVFYIPSVGYYGYKDGLYKNIFNSHKFARGQVGMIQNTSSRYLSYMDRTFNESVMQKINVLSDGGGGTPSDKDWVFDVDKEEVIAQVEVAHSWFFKFNKTRFSYADGGSNGICEYIAFLLMVEYNDFFVTKGYFSDAEVKKYITLEEGTDFKFAIPNVSDNFAYDLFSDFKRESLDVGDLNSLLKSFMEGKEIDCSGTGAYWLFGDPKKVIKSKGRPDMICGELPDTSDRGDIPHNVVAYGYFTEGTYTGKYLTHYGWDGCSQCIISRPFLSGYDWSIVNKETKHVHRYIFNIGGELKCGCESPV